MDTAETTPDRIIQWEQLRKNGQPVPLETFCKGEPGLQSQIELALLGLQATAWLEIPVDTISRQGSSEAELEKLCVGLQCSSSWNAAAQRSVPHELVGQTIGPYRIERGLGWGGMGEVYFANRIEDFQQPVAIKFIRQDVTNEVWRKRFERERQMLAALRHPNIGRLLDGGHLPNGRPYLVMEYIEGQRLDQHCNGLELPLLQRLKLFFELCDAMAYAHQRKIIHRDLKPSNILVDADGRVRVMDFGLARQLNEVGEDATLTEAPHVLGTPAYMSPEQAMGVAELTCASDVYSLGAILYQLLLGRPPFRGDHPLQTMSQVIKDDPIPPRRLDRTLSRDLETICLKCLEKNPVGRYQDAGWLLDDLHRFEQGRPIVSRPIPTWERIRRWSSRNRSLAGITVLLATGLLLASLLMIRNWQLALSARSQSDHNAEVAYKMSRAALRLTEKLLLRPDFSGEEMSFFEQTLYAYQQLAASPDALPRTQFELAQVHHFIGRLLTKQHKYSEARTAFEKQLNILETVCQKDPLELRFQYDQFFAHHSIAETFRAEGKLQSADEHDRLASDVLSRLIRLAPDNPFYAEAYATQLLLAGTMDQSHGKMEASEQRFRKALEITSRLVSKFPPRDEPPFYEHKQAQSNLLLAQNAVDRQEIQLAIDYVNGASELCLKVALRRPKDDEVRFFAVHMLSKSGAILMDCGELSSAREMLERAQSLVQEEAISPMQNDTWKEPLVHLETLIAWVEWREGHRESSRLAFQRLLNRMPADLSESIEIQRWSLLNHLANCPFPELRDLELINRLVLDLRPRLNDQSSREYWYILASGLYRLQHYRDAKTLCEKSIELSPRHYNSGYWLLAAIEAKLGDRTRCEQSLQLAADGVYRHANRNLPYDAEIRETLAQLQP